MKNEQRERVRIEHKEVTTMYPFEQTKMENYRGTFDEVEQFFTANGFDEGGGWEYDHGYFDYKLADNPGYLFIRVPVFAEEGEFGRNEAIVRIGKPFLLRHKYQRGIDDNVSMSMVNANASINQFSEPQDPDASLDEKDLRVGQSFIDNLDTAFAERFSK